MQRSASRFIGIDLGGGRGKTTALAELRSGANGAEVIEVATRSSTGKSPWTDDTLIARLELNPDRIIAIDRGRLTEDGTHEQLMDREGLYHYLNTVQLAP